MLITSDSRARVGLNTLYPLATLTLSMIKGQRRMWGIPPLRISTQMVKSPSQKKLIGILNNCVLVLLVVINLLKETKLTIAHRRSSKVRLTQLKNKKCPETLLKLLALVLELWINNITMSLPNIVLVRTQISGREAPFKVMLLKELLIERETILEILVGVQSTL